ncbi:MAG TPA: universal stress protein [Chloroflexota bacterium]|nr:universal stress protein [Chloroflexota bacterium]
MKNPILVPLDGSALSERAVPYGAWLGLATGAPLLLVSAIACPDDRVSLQAAEAGLAGLAEMLSAEGLDVETLVGVGDASRIIREAAQRDDASAIVMSTHGKGGPGRWLMGAVADQVLRRAEVPVFLIPGNTVAPWPADHPLRILVPLDGSPFAEAVLDPLCELTERPDAEILLLRVVEKRAKPRGWELIGDSLYEARDYLDFIAESLRDLGRRVSTLVVSGDAAPTISTVAREREVDLIAMTTHGRSSVARLIMGSVASGTITRARVPVLVVRPPILDRAITLCEIADRPDDRVPVPTASVPLSLAELDLVLRGLGTLVYEPGQDDQVVESSWDLLSRLKPLEAALYDDRPLEAVR